MIRVPVRLGEDAFIKGNISENNLARMVKTMQSFDLIMQVYGVEKYRACATSALREAKNKKTVIKKILRESGIHIEIIDGKREAAIIASTDLQELLAKNKCYLYVDVGGGSTELTLFDQGKPIASKSFKMGTLRLLYELAKDSVWDEIKQWITRHCDKKNAIEIIGSGGNINKLHKMSGKKIGQPLSYSWLKAWYRFLERMEYSDRIVELGLNPDRADVIVPAAKIFTQAAKWSKAQKIHVPKIGLSDGMIKTL